MCSHVSSSICSPKGGPFRHLSAHPHKACRAAARPASCPQPGAACAGTCATAAAAATPGTALQSRPSSEAAPSPRQSAPPPSTAQEEEEEEKEEIK
jgi:hypothetical protein